MQSLLRFVRSLRGRAAWHASRWRGATGSLKYVIRAALQWRLHDGWLSLLESPPLAGVSSIDGELVERYQHRYISLAWSRGMRFRALHDHYAFATLRFPRALLHMLYRERCVDIGTVALRSGQLLSIRLKAPIKRGREGELSISLINPVGQQVSYATVSFLDQGRTLVIGCLQGAADQAGPDVVRELTRECHGLRPKNLLLSLIRALAGAFDVGEVLGIASTAHVFARITGKVKADYDGFWLEAGGVVVEHGFYALPPRDPHRCASQVESKRRSEFRRRETLRSEACELVTAAFGFKRSTTLPVTTDLP